MSSEELRTFINRIEKIAGTCYYDEDDINDDIDILELHSNEYAELGFEIDKNTGLISVFLSFDYIDFKKEEYERGYYDTEEIENEIQTKLLESSCILFFKAHSMKYIVSVWDDGNYMCPGYVVRVGLCQEEYSNTIIQEFFSLFKEYLLTVACLNNEELRRYIFIAICHKHGIRVKCDKELTIGQASVIFKDIIPTNSNIDHYYLGKEYFLFTVEGRQYASEICPVEVFIDAQEMCELFENTVFNLNISESGDAFILQANSTHMALSIQAKEDTNRFYSRIEESSALISHSSIIPFASEKLKKFYSEDYVCLLEAFTSEIPLVITEGSTDWKHMKKFWTQFIKQACKINFFEYEPGNSQQGGSIKQEMGSATLLEMCKALSKIKLGKLFIFIADRDEPRIVKEMSDESKPYKYWANGVYSLVLPVPEHRISTPDICIEHFYSDADIKTFYTCSDKKERRLYLGNDFDKYGRDIKHGLLCVKRSLCGADSIKVIDGSNDTRVISMSENNDINYALSKQEFASQSTIIKNSTTFTAFSKLSDIIQEIIQDSKRR